MTKLFKRASLLFILMLLSTQAVRAAEFSDAFEKSFSSTSMSYKATASMNLEKNVEMDMPFTLKIDVAEDGGKSGNNYHEQGVANLSVSNLSDMPPELSDMSYINFLMRYKGSYQDTNKVAYGIFDEITVSSDGRQFKKIAEMMNQMAKFMTGKYFRLSLTELTKSLEPHLNGIASQEDLLVLNSLSGNSIREMTLAMGQLFDGLIQSGILKDSVQELSTRRTGTQRHIITLGTSINAQGAEVFRKSMMQFFDKAFPAFSSEIKQEMQWVTAEDIAKDINETLAQLKGTVVSFQVDIADGLIHHLQFDVDLHKMGLPLVLEETVAFDYSKSFELPIPQNSSQVIDFNKIVDGFVALAELGGASFSDPGYYDDNSLETSYHLVLDTIDEIDSQLFIYCGEDKTCRRQQINSLKKDLHQLKREGRVTPQEFRQKMKALNTLR